MGEEIADEFAQGLLALETNWQGPLSTNASVDEDAQTIPGPASVRRSAASRRTGGSSRRSIDPPTTATSGRGWWPKPRSSKRPTRHSAGRKIRDRCQTIASVVSILDSSARLRFDQQILNGRIHNLAEDLFVSIRMQLSVPLYDAIAVDRGANLDTLDVPLNDRLWLRDQLERIRLLGNEEDRLRAIEAIVHRTDPGPYGFYDDLGQPR